MLGTTHTIVGAAAAITFVNPSPLAAASGALAALLPDIDEPESTIGKWAWPVAMIAKPIFGHRGATHSLLFAIAGTAAAMSLPISNQAIPLAIGVGYLSHLTADAVSGRIPLLWPWPRRFGIPIIATGGWAERLVVLPAAILTTVSTFLS